MKPTGIRVFPLSRIKEPEAFGTRRNVFDYFCDRLKRKNPPGRFNIRSGQSKFLKGTLILFQYTERINEEEIIAHATLISDGCVKSEEYRGYVGYYHLDIDSINLYSTPVTKKEIYNIWQKDLWCSRLILDVAKYDDYVCLLKSKNNLKSMCLSREEYELISQ